MDLLHFAVPGRAFHLSDYAAPMWEHMEPFLEADGQKPPAFSLPISALMFLANINEVRRALNKKSRQRLEPASKLPLFSFYPSPPSFCAG